MAGGGWRVSPWRWHRQYCNQATRKEDDLSLCNPQHRQFTGLSATAQCTVTGSYGFASFASQVWLARSPYSWVSSCVHVWSTGDSKSAAAATDTFRKGKKVSTGFRLSINQWKQSFLVLCCAGGQLQGQGTVQQLFPAVAAFPCTAAATAAGSLH